ncbi:hypothetical protein [Chryseobacterium sp. 22458]|uniref:hypothetical protein n=1 Tax=Chryseobacterium sp. 22458 TaxID=3453921 RepID=UPI003F82A4A4
MEILKKLNIELQQYLKEISGDLTDDLVRLLKGENIQYLENKEQSDIKAFYFEYEFEYLNIICWGVDRAGKMATEKTALPGKNENTAQKNEKWSALIPEKIWTQAADFQDHYEGDNFDDILDEYDDEKYRLFEQWFFDCWKEAKTQTSVKMDAYFSIHDTYFRTDLNTLKTINEDEIAQRYN